MSFLGEVGGFVKGVGEGAWDAGKGTVQGVGSLAVGAYKVATDEEYRAQAWQQAVQDAQAVGSFAETALTDPAKAAGEVGDAAGAAWNKVHTAYDQAVANGQGSEFVGKLFGAGAVIAGTALIPGGAEADGLAFAGEAVETEGLLAGAGQVAADASAATRAATTGGDALAGTTAATRAAATVEPQAAAAGQMVADAATTRAAATGSDALAETGTATRAATAESDAAAGAGETAPARAGAADPLHGRTPTEFDDLASDPAHGGKIDPKSEQERRVGLDIEARGDVPGPLVRDPSSAAEFIDAAGQKWDVKGFNSNFAPRKGGFDLARDAGKVDKSLAQGEHVMLDTAKMSQADIAALKAEGEARGWGSRVQWWP